MLQNLKKVNWQCLMRLHLWTKWEPIGVNGCQKRECTLCGLVETKP